MADSSNPGFRSDDAANGNANSAGTNANGAQRPAGRTGSRRGFAAMDPSRQKEIASKGGRAAHAKGTAHEWSADEAREAGRKGGVAVSKDRAHMAAIGREGGGARGAARRRRLEQAASSPNVGNRVDREQSINVSRELGNTGLAASSSNGDSLGSRSGEERQGSAGTHRDTGRSSDRF